jgi:ketosteroid isomerase-like protein
MTPDDSPEAAEAQIRVTLDDWLDAVRAKDATRSVSHYSPDVACFGMGPPLRYRGAAAQRKVATDWFGSFEGPLGFDVHDLTIAAREDVAFAHALHHVTGKKKSGEATNMWFRSTMGLRRIEGRWLIAHEHTSEPFDMETLEAQLDLTP